MKLKAPDITQAQILAAITWVAAQAVSIGWLTSGNAAVIVQLSSTVVAAAWVVGDAVIRQGRAKIVAADKAGAHAVAAAKAAKR